MALGDSLSRGLGPMRSRSSAGCEGDSRTACSHLTRVRAW